MNGLLNRIIANTKGKHPDDNAILVKSSEELLAVAKRTDVKPVENNPKTVKERYYFGIFRELFKEAKFFYGQYKAIYKIEYTGEETDLITDRLERILDSIKEAFTVFEQYFLEMLESDEDSDIETAVFLLSSLGNENGFTKVSDILFERFTTCSKRMLNYYIEAFKYGIEKGLRERLEQVTNRTKRPEIKEACTTIIDFRQARKQYFEKNLK